MILVAAAAGANLVCVLAAGVAYFRLRRAVRELRQLVDEVEVQFSRAQRKPGHSEARIE